MLAGWKKCNRCGFTSPELQWDKEFYAKEGRWKLCIITNNSGIITKIDHVCNGEVKQQEPSGPVIPCQFCSHTMYGYFNRQEDLDVHVKQYHPNQDILYEEDFAVVKPADNDYVQRPCSKCTQETGNITVHPYKYGEVKGKTSFDCIR